MADPILVVIFLRGGADALGLVAPAADPDYLAARPAGLRVERDGDAAGHALGAALADVDFRLHPAARDLAELFGAGDLSIVHATGLAEATRSHFDAEARIERALPAGAGTGPGWLGRWLDAERPEGPLPALAVGTGMPGSLQGSRAAVAPAFEDLMLAPGHWLAGSASAGLGAAFGGRPDLRGPAEALSLARAMETRFWLPDEDLVRPYEPSVAYPEDSELTGPLLTVARAIKSDLGLRVATVDYGGWDTHVSQEGTFTGLVRGLSVALAAFWRDLGPRQSDVAVVVQSEFGRRLRPNASGGTDHGRAGAMMVLGPQAQGGRLLGRWPGLHHETLEEGADLAVTTDHREVLREVLVGHMGLARPDLVFPGLGAGAPGLYG